MKLAVYFDETNPETWISREESTLVKKCCEERGAEIVDNKALPKHLEGEAKIIVFAHDMVPESSLEKLKSFLERGGIIVWLGDVPFIKAVKDGEVRSLGREGGSRVLGFNPVSGTEICMANPTDSGKKLGLTLPYISTRPVPPRLVDVQLALNSRGEASSWIKKVGEGAFVRILDRPNPIRGVGLVILNTVLDALLEKYGISCGKPGLPSTLVSRLEKLAEKGYALPLEMALHLASEVEGGVEESINILTSEDPENALKKIAELVAAKLGAGETYWIGQSHIDWAWLWTWEETVEKCRFTFSQALKHMKKYPNFKYTQSSAAFYRWMEERYPEIFNEIKKRVKEGRWGLVGGSWTEHDCNVPSGESMVRQRLYGQRYYLSRFGRTAEVEWMPDTFGFAWTLPQILVKSGQKYMFTTKMDWSYVNKLPFRIFLWEGPDGSRVIAYQGRFARTYQPSLGIYREFASRTPLIGGTYSYVNLPEAGAGEHVKEMGVIYGVGDGGGGPTPLEVAAANFLTRLFPKNKLVTGEEYMKLLDKYRDRLPAWRDELYLENHRGTYTAQWIIKALNREAENLLVAVEKAAVIAYLKGMKYPAKDIEEAWKWVLSYQWHDPLPGSAIKEVYEEAQRDFNEHVFPTVKRIFEDAVRHLSHGDGESLALFNPLSWTREDIIEVECKGYVPEAEAQLTPEGKLAFKATLPPLSFTTLKLQEGRPSKYSIRIVEEAVLESQHYRVAVDKEGVKSLHDKDLQKEFLKDKITVISYFCRPKHWSNWNIMPEYWKHEKGRFKARRITLIEGPVYSSAVLEGEIEQSPATWEIRVYKSLKRVDFRLWIDWRTTERIVKMWFPLALKTDFAYASIPFGVYPRPFKPRTRFEEEKWEFPHQKWVCISDGEYSLNIANWPIHGSGIVNGVYGLTLIKSGNQPDPYCDIYPHRFKISLNTYKGGWKAGKPWRLGDEINYPILAAYIKGTIEENFLRRVEPDNVVVEAVKKHEDSGDIVLRVYDTSGDGGEVKLEFNRKVSKAAEIDFIELKELRSLQVKGSTVSFKLRPWEIKTVKLTLTIF